MDLKPLVIRGVEIEYPEGIPSGLVTTRPDTIDHFARESASDLVWSKSYGEEEREGNKPPIYLQREDDPFSYRNSIGLRNPGCEEGVRELRKIYPLPRGKKLVVSIFSKTAKGFQKVARTMAPVADILEMNESCPHSSQVTIGKDPHLAAEMVRAVRQVTDKPIIAKLTPMAEDIAAVAKAVEMAGADAISAINTVGPEIEVNSYTGKPILTSPIGGGLSGPIVRRRALECVSQIAHAVSIPVIGMGGITCADDAREFLKAGARGIAIGTARTGMDTYTCFEFARLLRDDFENGTNNAGGMVVSDYIMMYRPYRIKSIEQPAEDLRVFRFEDGIESEPGQFVFAWIPEVGERPFSVAYNKPLMLAVEKRGVTTSAMFGLKEGDELMVRGPYGKGFTHLDDDYVLVLGGTGAATGYALAKALQERGRRPVIMEGAGTASKLLFAEEFAEMGRFIPATDDGSAGVGGFVTAALASYLENGGRGSSFFNCGPEKMMEAAMDIEGHYRASENIFYSSEDYMGCGVGACGACSRNGYRSCVDGPVFRLDMVSL